MFFDRLRSGPLGVALLQLATAILLGVVALWCVNERAALSAAYGVAIALLATLLLLARQRILEMHSGWDASRQVRVAKRAIWERLALVAVLLSWGFLSGNVGSGWMIFGFVAGQAVWFVAMLFMWPMKS